MENNEFEKIQQSIDELQRQLNDLKSGKPSFQMQNASITDRDSDLGKLLKNTVDSIVEKASKIAKEHNEIGALILAVAGEGAAATVSYMESWDEINEEGISAALEPFTNPRRIAILKALNCPMTSSELSQKTGCVGGQLYHHLANLESSELIKKDGDKYMVRSSALLTLLGLFTVASGMPLARK